MSAKERARRVEQAKALRTVAGFSRDTRKPVDTCADYLLKYAPYLHYDRYLAAGYPSPPASSKGRAGTWSATGWS